MKMDVPEEVTVVGKTLQKAGFEAYLVGGCVRDIILKREPKDWDVATNASPEEIQKLFEDSVYENDFGTVLVKVKSQKSKVKSEEKGSNNIQNELSALNFPLSAIEVTTYRIEGKYTDKRHPDESEIREDNRRRSFAA